MEKSDLYDVKQYTDRELYSILNVSSPTDRELEAKIHFLIDKYERLSSDEGNKLARFFQDIYAHFFELSIEGFDISFSGVTKDVSNIFVSPTTKRDAPIDKNDPKQKAGIRDISFSIASDPSTDTIQTSQIGLVKSLDYSKGSVNPLLKQTIKRIICIDSQFRDKYTYPYSSDFTFNLSDTMIEVVSLKLYSVQIPYTWYTINNNYGSNFLYIKGNSPGIDTGNSDYKFEVAPGSYTSIELNAALQKSFRGIKTTDISFGTTNIDYGANASKSTITLDLKKTFLDIDFELEFPSWTDPTISNPEVSGNRFLSIPGYLGYNSKLYRSYNIYSYNLFDSPTSYSLNTDNNYFKIMLYNGPAEYDPANIIISHTYSLNNTGSFKRPELVNQIQAALGQYTDISGSITYEQSVLNIRIQLDRTQIAYIEKMKAVVVFPNDTTLWVGASSCFQFDNSINELNNIISETDTPTTLRSITNNPWIYLKCNKEFYGNEGIKTYNSYTNQGTPNTTHVLSDSSYITTIDNRFTITGDEYTLLNQTLYVETGNIVLSGSNYNAYGSAFTISGDTAIINGNADVYGNAFFKTNNPFTVSGERYTYNGNARIQGNTSIIGKGNITSTDYVINSTDTYIISGISGNVDVSGNLTTSANINIYTNTNVILDGSYKFSGDAFITGNIDVIQGSTTVKPNGNCLVSGNYSYHGDTYLRRGTISISRGNIQIKVPPTDSISIYEFKKFPNVFNLDTLVEYDSYDDISGNIYITSSDYSVTTSGNVIINTSDPLNPDPIYNNTLFNGNTTIYRDSIVLDISDAYKIGGSYQILQSGNIIGNTTITKGNVNVINSIPLNVVGTAYKVIGNINATGNVRITNPANVYGNVEVKGSYIFNGNTVIDGKLQGLHGNVSIYADDNTFRNIDSNNFYFLNKTKISGNVNISGNILIQSDSSYNISGNTYSLVENQATLIGNIFTLSGHSIIHGNSYSVSGPIQVYNDISVNDFIIDISNQTTSNLTEYIQNIQGNINQQTGLFKRDKLFDENGMVRLSIDSSANPLLYFKYNKKILPDNYTVDLSKFYDFLNLALNNVTINDKSNIIMTAGTNVITGYFRLTSKYIIDNDNNKIIINSTGPANSFVPKLELELEKREYFDYASLQNAINKMFTSYDSYNINLTGTNMVTNIDSRNNQINFILTIIINCELTQSDYTLYLYNQDIVKQPDILIPKFYDYINPTKWDSSTNHWSKELGFNENRYVLSEYKESTLKDGESSNVYGEIPLLSNTITLDNSNNYFYIRPINKPDGIAVDSSGNRPYIIKIELTHGTYSKESIMVAINNAFSSNDILNGSELSFITVNFKSYSNIRLNINKTFTTKDFKLVFYDLYSFVYCNIGVSGKSSKRNGTWDSTLGWILGFRLNTVYPLSSYVDSTNIVKLVGDTCMSVYLYNYFMIILDDFVQNHLNDGLVTITTADTGISLPSYANLTTLKCNPATNEITTLSSGFTAKQIYSANQLLKNKQTQEKNFISSGPFIQDIFGLIPIKVSGMSAGQPYIEFGGSLQLQERSYFGPVNIRRMRIQLINDKGDMVDLNGADWSFSLVCEQLYSNAFSDK